MCNDQYGKTQPNFGNGEISRLVMKSYVFTHYTKKVSVKIMQELRRNFLNNEFDV